MSRMKSIESSACAADCQSHWQTITSTTTVEIRTKASIEYACQERSIIITHRTMNSMVYRPTSGFFGHAGVQSAARMPKLVIEHLAGSLSDEPIHYLRGVTDPVCQRPVFQRQRARHSLNQCPISESATGRTG